MTARATESQPLDPKKIKQVKEFKHASPLIACRFDRTGQYVFAASQDRVIRRYHVETGKSQPLEGHESWVRSLTCTPDKKTLLAGDYAGRIVRWDIQTEKPSVQQTVDAHQGWIRALALAPTGNLLASCGNDGLVRLWSPSLQALETLRGHDCHVYNVAFHADGKHLVSADLKGNVKVWDVAAQVKGERTPVRQFDASILAKYDRSFRADIGGIRSIDFSADGTLLACAGISEVSNAFAGVGKPLIVLFDWQTGKQARLLRPKADFQGTAWGVRFHPAGFVVGVGSGNGSQLWLWKRDNGEQLHFLQLPAHGRDCDLSPDGSLLAVASFEGVLRLYG